MATFFSKQMTYPRYPVSGPGIGGRSLKVERAEINLATTGAMPAGSDVQLFKLHPHFRVRSGFVKIVGGAGAGVTYTVGDLGGGGAVADPARYFVSASAAAAGSNLTLAEAGRDFLTAPTARGGSAPYTIVTLTTGGATTNATGTIIVVLDGFVEEPE